MNKIISAVIRLLVLYTIFIVIGQIPFAISSIFSIIEAVTNSQNDIFNNILQFIVSLIPFIITWILYIAFLIFMWTNNEKISDYLTRKIDPLAKIDIKINQENLLKIALIILSVYIIITSIPEFIHQVLSSIIMKNRYPAETSNSLNLRNASQIIATIIKITISVSIIKNINRFIKFLNRIEAGSNTEK